MVSPYAKSTKPRVLITGANKGIGFAIAQQLVHTGKFHVLVGARTSDKAVAAIKQLKSINSAVADDDVTPLAIDIADDSSIAQAAKLLTDECGSIAILINNAGISSGPEGSSIRNDFRAVFETNLFGTAVVIDAFVPLLRADKYHDIRIVNVTTGLGQIGMAGKRDFPYNAKAFPAPAYRCSRAGVNMLTAVYSVQLAEENISVICAAPGFCRTDFTGGQGVKEASDGAKVIVRAAIEGDPKELYGTLVADEGTQFGW